MRPAGVAQSEGRLLASGALVQQAAQGAGLLALLVIVTILARRLSVTELAAYGLVASLAGYLLVLRFVLFVPVTVVGFAVFLGRYARSRV